MEPDFRLPVQVMAQADQVILQVLGVGGYGHLLLLGNGHQGLGTILKWRGSHSGKALELFWKGTTASGFMHWEGGMGGTQ
ncbi:hypothetical protein QF031_000279 [Pseudarthrobacter defluvii]|uniref:hypothetical protein n=1 Tax=Pseudarthrobacter defluvii TaxID=410837 RepID=UPI00278BA6A1|nr:hypothetical protein [Pseudarthrobacter defluvii]MDQ0767530.1 hypothetical protein [Pseudarthrobacter defluvii]